MLDVRAGSRVGPYKVIAPLEEGAIAGTSTLFIAQLAQVDVTQLVILKIVPVEEGGGEESVLKLNALRKEVEILQKLRHPGIVKIYPIPSRNGRREHYISRATNVPDKPWFCALEHLGGGSLETRLRELTILPLEEAVEIAYQVGSALDYMHARGYVHWDVKPDNVLFRHPRSENGAVEAVLTDFGIARSTHEPAVVAGSVRYMSPERLRVHLGEIPHDQVMDQRPADVYALGLVLYEMLAGNLPFVAEDAEGIKTAILKESPIPLSDFNYEVPPVIEDIIFQALEKDPAARPTVEKMVTMLDRAVPAPRVGVRAPSIPSAESPGEAVGQLEFMRRRPAAEPVVERPERKPSLAERLQHWAWGAVAVGIIVVGSLWVAGRGMGMGPLAPTSTPTATPTETPIPTPTVEILPPRVSEIRPASASTEEEIVRVTIEGGNFVETPVEVPEVSLICPGEGDIQCKGVRVLPGGSTIRCNFDISKAKAGLCSVQVRNPDGMRNELPDGFTIVAPTPTPMPTDTPTPTPTVTPRPWRATAVPPTAAPQPTSKPSKPSQPRPTSPPSKPPTIPPP